MSLVSGINALAVRIAAEIRDAILPRLLPPGGAQNQLLRKNASGDYQVGWVTPFSGSYADLSDRPSLGTASSRNIHVGDGAPSSPSVGDIWIDTSGT